MMAKGRGPQKGTILSADFRLADLKRRGHTVDITGTTSQASITIHRKEGHTHTVTITANDIPELTRAGLPWKLHLQTMLVARAIHAACDWSNDQDKEAT